METMQPRTEADSSELLNEARQRMRLAQSVLSSLGELTADMNNPHFGEHEHGSILAAELLLQDAEIAMEELDLKGKKARR